MKKLVLLTLLTTMARAQDAPDIQCVVTIQYAAPAPKQVFRVGVNDKRCSGAGLETAMERALLMVRATNAANQAR